MGMSTERVSKNRWTITTSLGVFNVLYFKDQLFIVHRDAKDYMRQWRVSDIEAAKDLVRDISKDASLTLFESPDEHACDCAECRYDVLDRKTRTQSFTLPIGLNESNPHTDAADCQCDLCTLQDGV